MPVRPHLRRAARAASSHKGRRTAMALAAVLLATPALSQTTAAVRPVSDATLRNPAAADWLQWGRTYDAQNFSPLKAIDRGNVKALAPAWRVSLPAGPSMPTP